VTVSATRDTSNAPGAEAVVVSIKDTGVGIPTELLPQLFELFTQVDRHLNRSQGGLGVGLALVRKLVELHGGTVIAASEGPGKGTELRVTLPLSSGPERP
jgi:signal transduction histidine kinase